jgi:hypothetical protein
VQYIEQEYKAREVIVALQTGRQTDKYSYFQFQKKPHPKKIQSNSTPWVSHQSRDMRHISPAYHPSLTLNTARSRSQLSSLDGNATRSRGIGPTVLDGSRPVEGVLGEGTSQCLLARDLLAADEAVDGNGDGAIDVVCAAVLGQSHFGESL